MSSRDSPVSFGGRRAERGRRPRVRYRHRPGSLCYCLPGLRWRLSWSPWDGYWVESSVRIAEGKVTEISYFDRRSYTVRKPDPHKTRNGEAPIHLAAVETEVLRSFPQVIAHLTHIRWDDGTPRQVGTVTFRTRGAVWTAEARDFDSCARLVVSAGSYDDALVLLDQLLGSEDAPWEPDIYLAERRGQQKKK